MMKRISLLCITGLLCAAVWAAPDMAPALPDLTLPSEEENQPAAASAAQKSAPGKSARKNTSSRAGKNRRNSRPPITNTASKANNEEVVVENLIEDTVVEPVKLSAAEVEKLLTPLPAPAAEQVPVQASSQTVQAAAETAVAEPSAFEPARDAQQPAAEAKTAETKVAYNPTSGRDPTLSPDDSLLIKHREEERLRAIEAERQRKINEERRRLAEIERQRQLELERLRDPSREIRGKIRINGIIGQEVFIGNKVYTVGKTVLGARIIQVQPDAVVFQYKGQKFTKKVQLK